MKEIAAILAQIGKPTKSFYSPDGTRLLILPHGGRMLGLYSDRSEENFYWTHSDLAAAETAAAFYAGGQWQNSGGDRTWLAPEVDLFLPHFPRLEGYFQQRSLDPGNYQVVDQDGSFKLVNRFSARFSRSGRDIGLQITKSFGAAPNPLRHERNLDLAGVEYAGYTQFTSLELTETSDAESVAVGLWNLVQMPHGGDLVIPTYAYSRPRRVFSTKGAIPARDLVAGSRGIRYRMRQSGEHKISVRAAAVCGRVGYSYDSPAGRSLIIRNFAVNPSGSYVDVPWNETDFFGFAVQACNVNSALGAFSELEYHIPAIGHSTGRTRCDDEAQVWAFRGESRAIGRIQRILLGPVSAA